MDSMCALCRRNFSSHKCERCSKDVCEFDFNVLAKACIVCAPRASSVKKAYGMPQGS